MKTVQDLPPALAWIFLSALLMPGALAGQGAAEPADPPAPNAAPAPAGTAGDAKVVAVVSDQPERPGQAGLGDRITITVDGVATLLEQAGGDCRQVVLFLDGAPLEGLSPERCDPQDGHIGFLLDRTEANDRTWHSLLGRPQGFSRTIPVTVGPGPERSLPTEVELELRILPRTGFYVIVAVLGITLAVFLRLAPRSALLRRPGSGPTGSRPYSLSRSQMAFWTLLVAAAYAFLWLVTGELDTITNSVLGLLAIGSGTALGAALIDSERPAGTGDGGAKPPGTEEAIGKGQAPEEPGPATTTSSFLQDVLSDGYGISIQRFQMFVWTLILGVIFCVGVYQTLDMPDFSPTLLALLGVSNGTYLGFKFPERQQSAGDRSA